MNTTIEQSTDLLQLIGAMFSINTISKMSRDELLQLFAMLQAIHTDNPNQVSTSELASTSPSSPPGVLTQVIKGSDVEAARAVMQMIAAVLGMIREGYSNKIDELQRVIDKHERDKRMQISGPISTGHANSLESFGLNTGWDKIATGDAATHFKRLTERHSSKTDAK